MIICDRCKQTVRANEIERHFEFVGDNLIACLVCYTALHAGYDKIKDELQAERDKRLGNWRNEWLHNFKAER